jgi:hypothetical protein
MSYTVIPRCPSARSLQDKLDLARTVGPDAGKQIRKRIKQGYVVESGEHPSHGVRRMLDEVCKLGDWPSVESLHNGGVDGGPLGKWWYMNAGDPYVATLLYNDETDTFSVGGWGDVVEAEER